VYIAYVDDSDTKSKVKKWQVLSAVIVKDVHFDGLELLMGTIIEDLIPADRVEEFKEFHAAELYGGHGVFEGIEQSKRFAAITSLLELIVNSSLPIVYGAVDLQWLMDQTFSSADPSDMAFRICLEGIEDWLLGDSLDSNVEHQESHMAVLIADNCDGKLKTTMLKSFRGLRKPIRPPEYRAGKLWHLHDDMYFGESNYSIGIQLADVCSYVIARHLEGAIEVKGFFDMIKDRIVYSKTEPANATEGVGVRKV
jgi:hypothetical protein